MHVSTWKVTKDLTKQGSVPKLGTYLPTLYVHAAPVSHELDETSTRVMITAFQINISSGATN